MRFNLYVPGQPTAEATTKHSDKMSNSFPLKKKKGGKKGNHQRQSIKIQVRWMAPE